MPDPLTTRARNACWDAIENWEFFDGVWKRLYKFDGDDSPELNPQPDQLPAIAIIPSPGISKMVLNRQVEHVYKLGILFFTATWNLTTSDSYWIEIIKSLFQPSDTTGTDYVKTVTGFHPIAEFQVDQIRTKVANTKVVMTSIEIVLRVRFDPYGS